MIEAAVVGGGPAGSYCAYSLAERGFHPVIFDHTHPREKPCAGVITPFAQELFPFLTRIPVARGERRQIRFISPSGRVFHLLTRGKVLCFSRLKLDSFLLQMALDRGAELANERVLSVQREGGLWKVKTAARLHRARLLIGADGVDSLVRKNTIESLGKSNMGFCFGYLVKGMEDEDMTIRLMAHRKGYAWIMPRDDHTCVGIGTAHLSLSRGLKEELDLFINRNYPHARKLTKWAALIPNVKHLRTLNVAVAGSNWVLIGDAAGHVDPVIGEGIPYALMDGELAAEAVAENRPEAFDRLWRKRYGRSFTINVELRKWVYTRPMLELYCVLLKCENSLHIQT